MKFISKLFIAIVTESNQYEVRQNAGDDNSPLTCDPECPQEEYVYDYQYAGSANSQGKFIWIQYKNVVWHHKARRFLPIVFVIKSTKDLYE